MSTGGYWDEHGQYWEEGSAYNSSESCVQLYGQRGAQTILFLFVAAHHCASQAFFAYGFGTGTIKVFDF